MDAVVVQPFRGGRGGDGVVAPQHRGHVRAGQVVSQTPGGGFLVDRAAGQQFVDDGAAGGFVTAAPAVPFGDVLLGHHARVCVDVGEHHVLEPAQLGQALVGLDVLLDSCCQAVRQLRVSEPHSAQDELQRDSAARELPASFQRFLGEGGEGPAEVGQHQTQAREHRGLDHTSQGGRGIGTAAVLRHLAEDLLRDGLGALERPLDRGRAEFCACRGQLGRRHD